MSNIVGVKDEEEEEEEEKRPRSKRQQKIQEEEKKEKAKEAKLEDATGKWTQPQPTIFVLDSPKIKGNTKIASFDMDDTLIETKYVYLFS